jgi:hypothetical protein
VTPVPGAPADAPDPAAAADETPPDAPRGPPERPAPPPTEADLRQVGLPDEDAARD